LRHDRERVTSIWGAYEVLFSSRNLNAKFQFPKAEGWERVSKVNQFLKDHREKRHSQKKIKRVV